MSFAPSVFVRVVAEEEEFLVVVIVATTLTEGLFLLTEYPAHLNTQTIAVTMKMMFVSFIYFSLFLNDMIIKIS